MDRKDFLNNIGISVLPFALINCKGCKKNDGSSAADGGSFLSNGVIVAKTKAGAFIALTMVQLFLKMEQLPMALHPKRLPFIILNLPVLI